MIIRCPQCEHSRSIRESAIPPTAELATCPKCKHRFRFRELQSSNGQAAEEEAESFARNRRQPFQGRGEADAPEVHRPQSAFRESAAQGDTDIWDAVDSMQRHWERQLGQQVTEVDSPLCGLPQGDSPCDSPAGPTPRQSRPLRNPRNALSDPEDRAEARPSAHGETPEWLDVFSQESGPEYGPAAHAARRRTGEGSFSADLPRAEAASAAEADPPSATGRASAPRGWRALFQGRDKQQPIPASHSPGSARSASPDGGDARRLPDERGREERHAEERNTEERNWRQAGNAAEAASSAPAASAFLYGQEGPLAEERVEQDLRMLRDSDDDERPTRDLGALRELPETPDFQDASDSPESQDFQEVLNSRDLPPGTEDAPRSSGDCRDSDEERESGGVPWENPARHGWIRGFMNTVRGVMFQPQPVFSGLDPSGSLAPGYLFFLVLGYLTILSSLAWGQAMVILLPEEAIPFSGRVALPVLLLLAPVALGLMLLFVTGLIRITLLLLEPDKADFGLIYKVVCYSVAPFILSIVPFVGPPIGAVWFIASLITGCRAALGLSWRLAVCTPLLPALMLIGALIWYFL